MIYAPRIPPSTILRTFRFTVEDGSVRTVRKLKGIMEVAFSLCPDEFSRNAMDTFKLLNI